MKGFLSLFCMLGIMLIMLSSCVEEEVPTFPIIVFNEVKVIPTVGVKFGGSIKNIARDKIVDFGVLWSQGKSTPTVSSSYILSLNTTSQNAADFSQDVSSFAEDTIYSARIYLKTSENTYYSTVQVFTTATTSTPIIYDIKPEFANYGDTLNVSGEGFGIDDINTTVIIENNIARIISTSDSLVRVELPYFNDEPIAILGRKDSLALTVLKFNNQSEKDYVHIQPPVVYSNEERVVYSGYEFEINGRGFHPYHTKVFLDEKKVEIKEMSYGLLRIRAPLLMDLSTKELVIQVGNKSTSAGNLQILAPVISNDFSDLEIRYNDSYKIIGENLDNTYLDFYLDDMILDKSIIDSQEVVITFPSEICQNNYDLNARISVGEMKFFVNKNTVKPEMKNFVISKYDFGAEITFELVNTPFTYLQFYIGGAEVTYSLRRFSETSASFVLPDNFTTEDGWIDIEMKTCGYDVIAESVFQFPKPNIITPDKKFEPYQFIEVSGQFIQGGTVDVYLNDQFISTASNSYVHNDRVGFTMPQQTDGIYDLSLKVNGQWSNEVQVEVVNTWEKLRSLNDIFPTRDNFNRIYDGGILTIRDNKLYFTDIFVGGTGKFYSMDLSSLVLTELSKPPTVDGSFTYDGDIGYLYFMDKLYEYDFLNDTWKTLSTNPYINSTWPFPVVVNNNTVFVFVIGGYYYTYDLISNIWTQHSNGPQDVSSSTNYRLAEDGNKVHILYFGSVYTFDLDQLNTTNSVYFGKSWMVPDVYGYRGILYNNELFMAGGNGSINAYKLDGSSWRVMRSPTFSYLLAGEGSYAYVIGESGIWRYNFELAE